MSSTYFSVLTERKGLQLMRAYQMKAYYRKGQKADIYCWEVARYWMNETGKVEVMARKRTMGIYMVDREAGGVAQLGEHLPCKQGVRSSILLISTKLFYHRTLTTA